jgi:hypothetical protein
VADMARGLAVYRRASLLLGLMFVVLALRRAERRA